MNEPMLAGELLELVRALAILNSSTVSRFSPLRREAKRIINAHANRAALRELRKEVDWRLAGRPL